MLRKSPLSWLGLQVFLLIPLAGTVHRFYWLSTTDDADLAPFEGATLEAPTVLGLHMISACLLMAFGAFQMSPQIRQNRPNTHRKLGYFAWAAGLIMGLSGVWLVLGFPMASGSEIPTQIVRLVFGSVVIWAAIDGLWAARQKDFFRHRKQMMRVYAIGAAATVNAFLFALWIAPGNTLTPRAFTVLSALGWSLALIWVEWRCKTKRPAASLRRAS